EEQEYETHAQSSLSDSTRTGGVPVATGLNIALDNANFPRQPTLVEGRTLLVSLAAIILGVAAGYIAQLLQALIGLITNLVFYGRFSLQMVTPFDNKLGWW